MGSGLSVFGGASLGSYIYLNSATTYLENDGTNVNIYASGSRVMQMSSGGGTLHGTWTADNSISTSDRRAKKEIKPLQRTLREFLGGQMTEQSVPSIAKKDQAGKAPAATSEDASSDAAVWLLRQLRPVSYSFKKGAESKYMRFGFIADELETVVPQIVRTVGQRDYADQKGVVYQDLIALLAAAAQGQQTVIEKQQLRMDKLLSAFATLKADLVTLKEDEGAEEPSHNLRKTKRKKTKKKKAKTASSAAAAKSVNSTNSSANSTSSSAE